MKQQVKDKSALRNAALRARNEIPLQGRAEKSRAIAVKFLSLPQFISSKWVLLFASFRSEVSTEGIITEALALGKHVLLPKVDRANATLTKHRIMCLDELVPGYMGIPEPTSTVCHKVEEADLIVVPGAAFDLSGARIGYGGGYYDKLLPRVKGQRPIVALCFDEQIYSSVPCEPHDVRMDIIVTDSRVVHCNG